MIESNQSAYDLKLFPQLVFYIGSQTIEII